MTDFQAKLDRKMALSRTFTPAAPVSRRDAFSGRFQQITDVVTAVSEPGRHVILYGERGVGKTSLANILSELLVPVGSGRREFAKRITCNAGDTFRSIWRRAFQALDLEIPEEWSYGAPNPDDIRIALSGLTPSMVIVFDEYDRIDDDETLSAMADTLKTLSDHVVQTKLVIVGVSDSIEALVGEHESVKRAVEEVQMPRMSRLEIMSIVDRGFREVGMNIEDDALIRVTKIAEGLPTYAHLLALKAGHRAIDLDESTVSLTHVDAAVADVLDSHMSMAAYSGAVQSSRSDSLYAQVLVACALTPKDGLGYFTAGAVREPLSRIMGRRYEIPAFARHLNAFMSIERGSVLQRIGVERNFRYRFRDPLLPPYALLSGIAGNLIPEDYVSELFAPDPDVDWDELLANLLAEEKK
ncbi:ATP-binding protein [Microbacterium suwonense]|nr:ATP-binding protein [Microbacterium suwonense]